MQYTRFFFGLHTAVMSLCVHPNHIRFHLLAHSWLITVSNIFWFPGAVMLDASVGCWFVSAVVQYSSFVVASWTLDHIYPCELHAQSIACLDTVIYASVWPSLTVLTLIFFLCIQYSPCPLSVFTRPYLAAHGHPICTICLECYYYYANCLDSITCVCVFNPFYPNQHELWLSLLSLFMHAFLWLHVIIFMLSFAYSMGCWYILLIWCSTAISMYAWLDSISKSTLVNT